MKRQVVQRPVAARLRGALVAGLMLSAATPAGPAFGQSASASVSGVVTDQTGGALPGVTITIANKSNGVTQTLVSGPEGRYRVVALQPAPYEITAELSGFGTVKRALTLFVGTDATA